MDSPARSPSLSPSDKQGKDRRRKSRHHSHHHHHHRKKRSRSRSRSRDDKRREQRERGDRAEKDNKRKERDSMQKSTTTTTSDRYAGGEGRDRDRDKERDYKYRSKDNHSLREEKRDSKKERSRHRDRSLSRDRRRWFFESWRKKNTKPQPSMIMSCHLPLLKKKSISFLYSCHAVCLRLFFQHLPGWRQLTHGSIQMYFSFSSHLWPFFFRFNWTSHNATTALIPTSLFFLVCPLMRKGNVSILWNKSKKKREYKRRCIHPLTNSLHFGRLSTSSDLRTNFDNIGTWIADNRKSNKRTCMLPNKYEIGFLQPLEDSFSGRLNHSCVTRPWHDDVTSFRDLAAAQVRVRPFFSPDVQLPFVD